MAQNLLLPDAAGAMKPYHMSGRSLGTIVMKPFRSRICYAAAHVVADPHRVDLTGQPLPDWEMTMRIRHRLWGLGFKVAEAMDTSQRGMGLSWENAQELIRYSINEAAKTPGADLACGAGTDQLDPDMVESIDEVVAAYEEQMDFIEGLGGRIILMASRALAKTAASSHDYVRVYSHLLGRARGRVILHWLGDMFDPQLRGYWGHATIAPAMEVVTGLIASHAAKIDGIKISLLKAEYEVAMRRRLPENVKMFTGDDFNYAELIAGDDQGFSHALLGIFDPIAPIAALAMHELDAGNTAAFRAILEPTVALSRKLFEPPTWKYKCGVVFLAWLNGFQDHFIMLGNQQNARDIVHYAEIFRLADQCGLLEQPDLAAGRMQELIVQRQK